MEPYQRVIDCTVNVAGPGHPNEPYFWVVGILGAIFLLGTASVIHHWIGDRDMQQSLERKQLLSDASIQSERNRRLTQENERLSAECDRLLDQVDEYEKRALAQTMKEATNGA